MHRTANSTGLDDLRILITGASGYLGRTLVPLLAGVGHDTRVLDLDRRNCDPRPDVRVTSLVGDVGDPATLRDVLSDVDAVVHLAAVVGYPACDAAPDLAHRTNVDALRTLLAHREPHVRFVFASTASVYGQVRDGVCDEDSPCQPVSIYGRTKLTGESLVLAAGNAAALRFTTAFGVGPVTRLDLLLHRLSLEAVLDGKISLYQPNAVRSFVHVHDIARAIVLALDCWSAVDGLVINVGSTAATHSKLELASAIANRTGASVHIADGIDADCRDYRISFDRIESLGFVASRTVLDGIEEILALAQELDEITLRTASRVFCPRPVPAAVAPSTAGRSPRD